MKPEISIIVPVYNSSKMLKRCIESILKQTFTDFELILVNDGSTDDSGSICDFYKNVDQRIKVIHQDNRGAGAARNTGIDYSSGKYLMFCDSDDVTGENWILHLIEKAGEQILPIGSFCSSENCLGKIKELGIEAGLHPKRDYWNFNKAGIAGYLWNAVYDRSVVVDNSIRLRESKEDGNYNEDLIFNLEYVKHIKQIVYTGYSDYAYIKRSDSLSVSYPKYYFDKYYEKYLLWKEFLDDNDIFDQDLYSNTLYRILVGLNAVIDRSAINDFNAYNDFVCAVKNEILKEVLSAADTSYENRFVIDCLKNRKTLSVWIYLQLAKMKRRLLV